MLRRPPISTLTAHLFPYPTPFRSNAAPGGGENRIGDGGGDDRDADLAEPAGLAIALDELHQYPRALRQARQAELAELARGREPAFIVGRRTDRGGEAEDQSALDLLVRDRRVDEPPGVDDRHQFFDQQALVASFG